jgi:DNA polymerase III delta subunit
MAALGGTVTRRPAEEVLAELEAAEQAARASEKEARRVMREARKAERAEKREQSKEMWDERLAALKAKLSHTGQA